MKPAMQTPVNATHNKLVGYLLWIFGFTGAHRFYFGKPKTGILWLLTGGLFLIGWVVDLFLIPGMDRDADRRFVSGSIEYSVAWILLTFLGVLGIHRFYMGKWGTGILYLLTGGGFLIGVVYDFCTLNTQISELNSSE
jgi:TM2 domain-containing membrane protein YozV